MKNVLILGAGLVASPMVNYLLNVKSFKVLIASRTLSKAKHLINNNENGSAVELLADDESKLENLIRESDIAISLLPYTYHLRVAKYCLKHGVSLVTTSYVSEKMAQLDAEARSKGIIILNEIGLDPGIDHMSAMRIIDDVHAQGGKIAHFRSYCGGLPAPEINDNPFGYKFSWSPRGVLMAGRNAARFLENGHEKLVKGEDLFRNHWPLQIEHLDLETYPNRDSIPYIDLYGIQETKTMYRGTLRYPGWSDALLAISRLGFLGETSLNRHRGVSHLELTNQVLGIRNDADPVEHISTILESDKKQEIISKLEWLGLFDDQPLEQEVGTPIDFLTTLMLEKMKYQPGQRDMIVLRHDFEAAFPDRRERITSTLIDYGVVNGPSAMSRTVSLPAAIAVKLILEGEIDEVGVRIPVAKEIYQPVLQELENLDIVCRESREILEKSEVR